jgi:hypothetical protein
MKKSQGKAAVICWIVLACESAGVSTRAMAEELVILNDREPKAAEFAHIAREFFSGVKARDLERIAALAGPEDADYLREKLANSETLEYRYLFSNSGSAGVVFEGWRDIRWFAARRKTDRQNDDGVLICMASIDDGRPWPPASSTIRKLDQARQICCAFTYTLDGRRVVGFNFLYPGNSVDPD